MNTFFLCDTKFCTFCGFFDSLELIKILLDFTSHVTYFQRCTVYQTAKSLSGAQKWPDKVVGHYGKVCGIHFDPRLPE